MKEAFMATEATEFKWSNRKNGITSYVLEKKNNKGKVIATVTIIDTDKDGGFDAHDSMKFSDGAASIFSADEIKKAVLKGTKPGKDESGYDATDSNRFGKVSNNVKELPKIEKDKDGKYQIKAEKDTEYTLESFMNFDKEAEAQKDKSADGANKTPEKDGNNKDSDSQSTEIPLFDHRILTDDGPSFMHDPDFNLRLNHVYTSSVADSMLMGAPEVGGFCGPFGSSFGGGFGGFGGFGAPMMFPMGPLFGGLIGGACGGLFGGLFGGRGGFSTGFGAGFLGGIFGGLFSGMFSTPSYSYPQMSYQQGGYPQYRAPQEQYYTPVPQQQASEAAAQQTSTPVPQSTTPAPTAQPAAGATTPAGTAPATGAAGTTAAPATDASATAGAATAPAANATSTTTPTGEAQPQEVTIGVIKARRDEYSAKIDEVGRKETTADGSTYSNHIRFLAKLNPAIAAAEALDPNSKDYKDRLDKLNRDINVVMERLEAHVNKKSAPAGSAPEATTASTPTPASSSPAPTGAPAPTPASAAPSPAQAPAPAAESKPSPASASVVAPTSASADSKQMFKAGQERNVKIGNPLLLEGTTSVTYVLSSPEGDEKGYNLVVKTATINDPEKVNFITKKVNDEHKTNPKGKVINPAFFIVQNAVYQDLRNIQKTNSLPDCSLSFMKNHEAEAQRLGLKLDENGKYSVSAPMPAPSVAPTTVSSSDADSCAPNIDPPPSDTGVSVGGDSKSTAAPEPAESAPLAQKKEAPGVDPFENPNFESRNSSKEVAAVIKAFSQRVNRAGKDIDELRKIRTDISNYQGRLNETTQRKQYQELENLITKISALIEKAPQKPVEEDKPVVVTTPPVAAAKPVTPAPIQPAKLNATQSPAKVEPAPTPAAATPPPAKAELAPKPAAIVPPPVTSTEPPKILSLDELSHIPPRLTGSTDADRANLMKDAFPKAESKPVTPPVAAKATTEVPKPTVELPPAELTKRLRQLSLDSYSKDPKKLKAVFDEATNIKTTYKNLTPEDVAMLNRTIANAGTPQKMVFNSGTQDNSGGLKEKVNEFANNNKTIPEDTASKIAELKKAQGYVAELKALAKKQNNNVMTMKTPLMTKTLALYKSIPSGQTEQWMNDLLRELDSIH